MSESINIDLVGNSEIIRIEFTDGWHEIPEWAVYLEGGKEKLIEKAGELSEFTFIEFMEVMHEKQTAQSLNDFQNQFTANHFGHIL